MHSYQVDEDIKNRAFILAAIFAFIAAGLLAKGIEWLPFDVPWWIETPSVLGFFGFFMWLFDNYLWGLTIIQRWDWICIPDIGGSWEAELKSSYLGFDTPIFGTVLIRQTATKMCITFRTRLWQ